VAYPIIIADSLTNDFVGEDSAGKIRVHVGAEEAQRILGSSKNGFRGPLPTFLRNAVEAQQAAQSVGIISVRDWHDPTDPRQIPELLRYGNHNIQGTPGAEYITPIQEIYDQGKVEYLDIHSLSIPIVALRDAVQRLTGIDMLEDLDRLDELLFVITGTHTNIRVFDTADSLRHKFGVENVVVCPHLVASANLAEHGNALRSWMPGKLIRVAQSVREVSEWIGIAPPARESIHWVESCSIEPKDLRELMDSDQRAILETIFMGYERVDIKKLGGGFSGSVLLLCQAKSNGTETEPVVLKIDRHHQIKREADGYLRVKKWLGSYIPNFEAPVSMGEYTGFQIALASLEGKPRTFQSLFEEMKDQEGIQFLEAKLRRSLRILKNRLYKNTKRKETLNPIEQLSLQNPRHGDWMQQNVSHIVPGQQDEGALELGEGVSVDNPLAFFDAIQQYRGTMEANTGFCHRDLNFANHMLDEQQNIWFIDWANCGEDLIEVDFAKMENEIKFVMSKEFKEEDLPNLLLFERFLLGSMELSPLEELPEELNFVRHDLRFQKMYRLVSLLREFYVGSKEDGPNADVLYKLALLRYSSHTLSFDARAGKGECELPALKYALLSTSLLTSQIHHHLYES